MHIHYFDQWSYQWAEFLPPTSMKALSFIKLEKAAWSLLQRCWVGGFSARWLLPGALYVFFARLDPSSFLSSLLFFSLSPSPLPSLYLFLFFLIYFFFFSFWGYFDRFLYKKSQEKPHRWGLDRLWPMCGSKPPLSV